MELLPIVLFCVLFAVALFAPLRWSIVAYVLLSTVDFYSDSHNIGLMNGLKGLLYPVVLLWRLKAYSGHGKVVLAPVAWILLIVDAGICSFWSLFPLAAAKITVEMIGSLLICLAFMRATKAGFLTPSSILVPSVIGVLAIGIVHSIYMPAYGDSQLRFSGFTTAQGYASLLAALFALSLGARTLRAPVRLLLCVSLFSAVLLNGSRIYAIGLVAATLVALIVAYTAPWIKAFGVAAIILTVLALIAQKDFLLQTISQYARLNRVAETVNAIYEGDMRSPGLGTYEFRRGVYQRALKSIAESSLLELTFGHGTSNGRVLRGTLARGVGDPNRAVHNEWLRILYEWGSVGLALWIVFICSVVWYAIQGVRKDRLGYSRALLIFMPAFLAGFTTENILAGAGHAENLGFVLLAALATVSHRKRVMYLPTSLTVPQYPSERGRVEVLGLNPFTLPSPARR